MSERTAKHGRNYRCGRVYWDNFRIARNSGGTTAFPTSGLLAGFAGFTSASSAFTDLSEKFVLKMAGAAAVFGNDVAVSAELVLVGR